MGSQDIVKMQKGDVLVQEGDDSTQMYFLKSGTLSVNKMIDGKDQQIGTIYAGELVGEMSFLDKEPRSASVRAIGDAELLVIPAEKFEKMLEELPAWYRALVNTLLDRLRRTNEKISI